jgi:hypothetical protein
MSTPYPKRRWFRFSLRTLFVVVTVFGCWLGYELNWIRQRHEAIYWLEASSDSWYAPSQTGAKVQADPPWSLRLFGERAIVGIGMDRQQFTGLVPYSPTELKRLFPEARVDYSRNRRYEDAPPD